MILKVTIKPEEWMSLTPNKRKLIKDALELRTNITLIEHLDEIEAAHSDLYHLLYGEEEQV